ncbi:MAG: MFS transporter, partial [Gaiellales bacterium]
MTGSRTFASPRTAVGTAFFVHAMITGSFAGRVPAIKHGLGVTDAQLGAALFAAALGTLLGGRVGGVLAARFGPRRMVRIGMPAYAALLVVTALAGSLAAIAVVLLVYGIVAASVDVCTNAEAVVVEREHGKPLMSGFHGMWSIGLLAGGGLAIAAAAADLSTTVHFGLIAAAAILVSAPLLTGLPRREPPPRQASRGDRWSGAVIVLGMIAFCSFFAEGAAADWSAVFLHDRADAGPALAAAAFASFSLAMAASRLAGDAIALRVGPVRLARAGSIVSAAGLALALLVPVPGAGLVGFALLGIGLGPVVPTVISAAGSARLGTTEGVVSRVFTLGYAGSVIGPAVIGFVAGRVGLRAALVIPVLLVLVIALVAVAQ